MTADAPPSRRVFLALMLGAEAGARAMGEVTAALGGEERARRCFRLPREDGLHATLFFLGDVESARIEVLGAVAAESLAHRPAPRLRLGPAGAFPRRGRERVLWLGVEEREEEGRLAALHRAVLALVGDAGFDTRQDERRGLVAHVTVARPRNPRRPRVPERFYELDPDRPWDPPELALVESVRARGPNLYVPRVRIPLAP